MDLVFLVDTSGSIRSRDPSDGSYSYWELMKQYMKEVTDRFAGQGSVRVAVLEIGRSARVVTPLTDATSAKNAIDGMRYRGDVSNLETGLQAVITSVLDTSSNRDDAFDVVMVLTDDAPNRNAADVAAHANAIRVTGPTGAKLGTALVAGTPTSADRGELLRFGLIDSADELQFITNPFALRSNVDATVALLCGYLLQCTTAAGCPGIASPPPGKQVSITRIPVPGGPRGPERFAAMSNCT